MQKLIANQPFFANPAWGLPALPRDEAGEVIRDQWVQPGQVLFVDMDYWIHYYQAYCSVVSEGDTVAKVEAPVEAPAAESAPPEVTAPAPPQTEEG